MVEEKLHLYSSSNIVVISKVCHKGIAVEHERLPAARCLSAGSRLWRHSSMMASQCLHRQISLAQLK